MFFKNIIDIRRKLINITKNINKAKKRPIKGFIDGINYDTGQIFGWAFSNLNPNSRVKLNVYINNLFCKEIVANIYREDLFKSGIGDGRHSFTLYLTNLNFVECLKEIPEDGIIKISIKDKDFDVELNNSPIFIDIRRVFKYQNLLKLIKTIKNTSISDDDDKHIIVDAKIYQTHNSALRISELSLINKCRENIDSIHKNIDSFIKNNKSAEVISIDIWDTLFFRKSHPDEVKMNSARILYLKYRNYLKPAYKDYIAIYRARKFAEDISSRTTDYEYSYKESIPVLLSEIFDYGTQENIYSEAFRDLVETELLSEKHNLILNDKLLELLLNLSKIYKLIFISDFYLGKEFIFNLLGYLGIDQLFIKGYVSCDYFKNKRSGDLFDVVLEEFNIKPNKLIHIGDNYISDFSVPMAKGINAFLYDIKSCFYKQLNSGLNINFESMLAYNYKPHLDLIETLIKNFRNLKTTSEDY